MIIELSESTPSWWGFFFKPFILYPLVTIGLIVLVYLIYSFFRNSNCWGRGEEQGEQEEEEEEEEEEQEEEELFDYAQDEENIRRGA